MTNSENIIIYVYLTQDKLLLKWNNDKVIYCKKIIYLENWDLLILFLVPRIYDVF